MTTKYHDRPLRDIGTAMRSSALAFIAAVAALDCSSAQRERTSGYLHVQVGPLPQCDYGVGYERPLRVDLIYDDAIVATSYTAGTFRGASSLDVSLYAPNAVEGRYVIRFGKCPSMVDDPPGSVACDEVQWVREMSAWLTPRGLESPELVRYYRVRNRCMDPAAELGGEAERDDPALGRRP